MRAAIHYSECERAVEHELEDWGRRAPGRRHGRRRGGLGTALVDFDDDAVDDVVDVDAARGHAIEACGGGEARRDPQKLEVLAERHGARLYAEGGHGEQDALGLDARAGGPDVGERFVNGFGQGRRAGVVRKHQERSKPERLFADDLGVDGIFEALEAVGVWKEHDDAAAQPADREQRGRPAVHEGSSRLAVEAVEEGVFDGVFRVKLAEPVELDREHVEEDRGVLVLLQEARDEAAGVLFDVAVYRVLAGERARLGGEVLLEVIGELGVDGGVGLEGVGEVQAVDGLGADGRDGALVACEDGVELAEGGLARRGRGAQHREREADRERGDGDGGARGRRRGRRRERGGHALAEDGEPGGGEHLRGSGLGVLK
jgi:hypothetical protein